jgi:hypothetical protein
MSKTVKAESPHGFTPRQAADVLGWSYQWLANRRWAGKPPRWIRISGRIYYPVQSLLEFQKSLKTEGGGDE